MRDVTFGEVASQVRKGRAPQVLAALRNAVIALLRDAGWDNIAATLRYNASSASPPHDNRKTLRPALACLLRLATP